MKQKTITQAEFKKEKEEKLREFRLLPVEERLSKTVNKILNNVRANTGSSEIYADMLLSMLPNKNHKVNIGDWCYRVDADVKEMIRELMGNYNGDLIWKYEELVLPHIDEIEKYLNKTHQKGY